MWLQGEVKFLKEEALKQKPARRFRKFILEAELQLVPIIFTAREGNFIVLRSGCTLVVVTM